MRKRRRGRPRAYLVAAAVMATLATVLLHGIVSGSGHAVAAAGPEVSVVVAARPVARGTALTRQDLRLGRMPGAYAPPGALAEVSKAAGRVVLADLAPGEVVTETRLARVRAGPVASLVPRGLRAFAVPTSLPLGAVVAGDRVDVLATYNQGQPHSEMAVESVEVLFVLAPSSSAAPGDGLGLDASGAGVPPPVTLVLLVSPDQETSLAYARAFASLEVTINPAG